MGLIGLLITVVIIILFFVFSGLPNFTSIFTSKITPNDSIKLENRAQEVMDNTAEKAKQQQDQIKNIDIP